MENLNAEQVKKSLEYWVEKYQSKYYTNHAKDALALIRELTEENERLSKATEEAVRSFTRLETLYKIECKRVDTIKADTVRKMQERLKAEMSFGRYIQADQIDQIAKEMLEEET